jgi:putative ABC transport system permease protein
VLGLGVSLGLSRLLSSLMFGITTNDPPTYAAGSAITAVMIFVACHVPSRRAMDVNPMEILRHE